MNIILKEDVEGLGYKYDLVKVRDGYGRNFLIPRNLAEVATAGNLKHRDETLRQSAMKLGRVKEAAEVLAAKIAEVKLEFKMKVGENGKLFGSVTTSNIADLLKAQGVDIDRRKIILPAEIKSTGEFEASIELHREVKTPILVTVLAE
jgi:large subunit ribosomal protein L9